MPAPQGGSDEMSCGLQARILSELEALAAAQGRMEAALGGVSSAQRSAAQSMADMARDLGSVADILRVRGDAAAAAAPSLKPQQKYNSNLSETTSDAPHGVPVDTTSSVKSDLALTLPPGWPSSIALRDHFDGIDRKHSVFGKNRARIQSRRGSHMSASRLELVAATDVGGSSTGPLRCRVRTISPNSNLHMVFGLCSVLVLINDLFVVPFLLAWDFPITGFPKLASVAAACFWTLDVLLNFVSGYSSGGVLVMEPLPIARRYMKSWLLPDLAVLACDWLSIVLVALTDSGNGSTGRGLRMLRITKIGRILRIIAMFRMFKLAVVVEEHMERKLSETYRHLLRILTIFCATVWLNHLLACVFFALGRSAPSNTGNHWVDASFAGIEEDVAYQYVTSFHWCVSQLTLGANDVEVCNTIERVFNVLMLMLGLVFSCTMISSLSATMVEFQTLAKDKKEKLRTLRRYLRENKVDRSVAGLVQQQAAERLGKIAHLTEKDVHALEFISASLRTKLHFDICECHIARYPLWRLWRNLDVSLVRQFCVECVSLLFPLPRDDLFRPGTMADRCYFVVSGDLRYTQDAGSSKVEDTTARPVVAGQWLGEAAIWSHWIYVGTLEAETECRLLAVDVDQLGQVLHRNRMVHEIAVEYGRAFCRQLAAAVPPSAPWPDDLGVPGTGYGGIVASMESGMQLTIGLDALEHGAGWAPRGPADAQGLERLSWHPCVSQSKVEGLRDELLARRCALVLSGAGDLERVVRVVAVRLEQGDCSIFAQLAHQRGGDPSAVAGCRLPGGVQRHDEPISDTLGRVLRRLNLAASGVEITGTELDVEWEDSKKHGVRTQYLRTVYHVEPRVEFDASHMETCQRSVRRAPSTPEPCAELSIRRSASASLRRVSTPPAEVTLSSCDIFMLQEEDETRFYSWLTPSEFDLLRTAAGETVLLARVAELCKSPASSGSLPPEQILARSGSTLVKKTQSL